MTTNTPIATKENDAEWVKIRPRTGWRAVDWRELWMYRDLLRFLVWRDIRARYAQSVLGIGWAVLQPVFNMIVFTVIFGNLARVNSDGVPYAIFSFVALVPWTYFSSALSGSSGSLLASRQMFTKVYFPRLLIPITPAVGRLIDFGIAMIVVFILMLVFQATPTVYVWALPLLVIIMFLTAVGGGMWLTAAAVRYRDINYATGFMIQALMFISPVVYPASNVPDQFLWIYGMNPMAGVIEGFRSALLATNPMPWGLIIQALIVSIVLFVTGAFYFRRMESVFADVI